MTKNAAVKDTNDDFRFVCAQDGDTTMPLFKWYIGHTATALVAFQSPTNPTETTHGHLYRAVIGPFRTRRAAQWAEQYGFLNPHFQHVNDAERIARHMGRKAQ